MMSGLENVEVMEWVAFASSIYVNIPILSNVKLYLLDYYCLNYLTGFEFHLHNISNFNLSRLRIDWPIDLDID